MVSQKIKDKVATRIKKREEIQSSKLYNAFRRVEGTEISDRTIGKAIQELDEEGLIERSGHGASTVCVWLGN